MGYGLRLRQRLLQTMMYGVNTVNPKIEDRFSHSFNKIASVECGMGELG